MGLALGALTGDGELAAAGMAAGAIAGGASGAMFEYDQNRQDRRARMVADSISSNKAGETVSQAGQRHLADFVGEWNVDIWVRGTDSSAQAASGTARVSMTRQDSLRIDYHDLFSNGQAVAISGHSTITAPANAGISLVNNFSNLPAEVKYTGEYLPEKNSYTFYPTSGHGTKIIGGIIQSRYRLELKVSNNNMFVAESYMMVDDQEQVVQSYRFSRR